MGLGCALENLVLGSAARGLRPTVTMLPDGDDSARVARIELTPEEPQSSPLYKAIGRRHTNRGLYEPDQGR